MRSLIASRVRVTISCPALRRPGRPFFRKLARSFRLPFPCPTVSDSSPPAARPAPDFAAMVAAYDHMNHYGRANGMALTVPEPGQAEYRMTIREEHLSSPNTCHGGVLAGLMDAALGAAALSLAFTAREFVSTVEFKMNYLHAVHLHEVLVARGVVDHSGKTLMVSSCVIYRVVADQPEVAVARGLGTFNRYPANKRDFAQLVLA